MVVVAIIGILAATAAVMYRDAIRRAKEATLKHNLSILRDVINQYKADRQKYPESLEALVEAGYLRTIPIDPITDRAETWQPVFNETDFDDPFADPGMVDVRSGAEGATFDGVPYAEL
jgi:general secretion pathway protein G